MTINFKTVALTLTIAAMARVATRNVTDGTNKARIASCKRINEKYALNYIKYPCRYPVNLTL